MSIVAVGLWSWHRFSASTVKSLQVERPNQRSAKDVPR
jgi:hypothetical protein